MEWTMRRIRKERKISLRAVDELTGISFRKLSEIENGQVIARPDELEKIAAALSVDVNELQYRQDKYRL